MTPRFSICVYCGSRPGAAPLAAYTSGRFDLPQLGVIAAGWVAVWALLSRFHPQRQFWHDAWAGTRLVDAG